jgi:hypothetical protein
MSSTMAMWRTARANFQDIFASVCIVDQYQAGAADQLTYWVRERGVSGLRLFATDRSVRREPHNVESNYPATHYRSFKEQVEMEREDLAFLPQEDQRWLLGETALSLWPAPR